ncbi:MAG: hypothetical protein A2846_03020 [Candidatus Doudnabacteria bacterium RIFCSPHIGHO2_01_FULL_49_9]|uniref:Uncharacterized protein n=1 Tax=Candidatus Doudnabacteria bacterium RIFCSPHIGHO2_01_FULL_49_9 TaxID=1817827 RepID=A0A1F5P301_9BACT|nr:MAG: hypothetical protein A2846_03020 [Candidatus Doudnabacteria bacterium RIFCSPHIGHO2_01_FULL_49_9]
MSELTREHFDKQLEKLVTKDYLVEYTNQVIFPRVEEIVEEKTKAFRNEILTSNDKLAVKLDKILAEQQAITAGFKRLQERINYLEAVVKVLAEKEGLPFTPPEL